jgi:hypothetical protein
MSTNKYILSKYIEILNLLRKYYIPFNTVKYDEEQPWNN